MDAGLLERYRGRGTFVNIRRSPAQQRMLAFLFCRVPNVSGAYDLLVRGVEEAATERGYQLMLANSGHDLGALEQVARLNEVRVAGTIVAPLIAPHTDDRTAAVLQALRRTNQKVVLLDEFGSADSIPSVCSQNRRRCMS